MSSEFLKSHISNLYKNIDNKKNIVKNYKTKTKNIDKKENITKNIRKDYIGEAKKEKVVKTNKVNKLILILSGAKPEKKTKNKLNKLFKLQDKHI
jgi:hypothetical protein